MRHASAGERRSERCQAATTVPSAVGGSPSAPSSRSWSIQESGAREAAPVRRACSAISAVTSGTEPAVAFRRATCATSAGCQPRSQVWSSAPSSAASPVPGRRPRRMPCVASVAGESPGRPRRRLSMRAAVWRRSESHASSNMRPMRARGCRRRGRRRLWTAGRRPQAPARVWPWPPPYRVAEAAAAARRQRRHGPPLDRQRAAARPPRGRRTGGRSTAGTSPGWPRELHEAPTPGTHPLVVGAQPAGRHRDPGRPRHRHGAGGDPGGPVPAGLAHVAGGRRRAGPRDRRPRRGDGQGDTQVSVDVPRTGTHVSTRCGTGR